jgi:hypothetical protein
MSCKNEMAKSVTPLCLMGENHIVGNLFVAKTDKYCHEMPKIEAILPSPQRRRTQDEVASWSGVYDLTPTPLLRGEGKSCYSFRTRHKSSFKKFYDFLADEIYLTWQESINLAPLSDDEAGFSFWHSNC